MIRTEWQEHAPPQPSPKARELKSSPWGGFRRGYRHSPLASRHFFAITEISTCTSLGRRDTSTVSRAGKSAVK